MANVKLEAKSMTRNRDKVILVAVNVKSGKEIEYSINMNSGRFYNETSRRDLETNPLDRISSFENVEMENKAAFIALVDYIVSHRWHTPFEQLEHAFSVLDMLDVRTDWRGKGYIRSYPPTKNPPKGFVKWCKDNDRYYSDDALVEFSREQMAKHWGEIPQMAMDYIKQNNTLVRLLDDVTNKTLVHTLVKCIGISAKNWENIYSNTFMHNIYEMLDAHWEFDNNRSIGYNYKLYDAKKNQQREMNIAAKQYQIKELEALDNDNYCVWVPLCLDDFTNEGKQQNNCVGSYYHDSIIEGRNLIYFIRRKDNPKKSYHTCRYSVRDRHTVEDRIKNNDCERGNTELEAFRNMIDETITRLITAN